MGADANEPAFSSGTFGATVVLKLVRSLASAQIESCSALLTVALQHPLLANGLRSAAAGGAALRDVEASFSGTEPRFEFQHVQLMVEAFRHLDLHADPGLRELLMRRAYLVKDFGLAEQLANETIRSHKDDKTQVECHNILGRISLDRGDFRAAAQAFERGATAARTARLERKEWDQRTNRVYALQCLPDNVRALQEIDIAEGIARKLQDPDALAKTLTDRGVCEMNLGNPEQARNIFQEAIPIAERATDKTLLSNVLGNLGNLATMAEDYEAAEDYHRRALAISRTLADQESLQFDLNNLAVALWYNGSSDEAVEAEKEALEIARGRNDEESVTRYSEFLNRMLKTLGYYSEPPAAEIAPAHQTAPPAASPKPGQQSNYKLEREVRALLSDRKLKEARALLEQRISDSPPEVTLLCLYGIVLYLCQENEKARAQFERAIELFPEEIEPHLRLVDFCAGTGELKPLAKKYEKAISEQPRLAALRTALALIYSRQGRLDEAIQHGLEGSRLASGQELALRILAEVQLARATSLLRTNWDGAWLAFEDCAATLGQLTNLDSDQSAQWLEYAGRSFESFAEQSHRTNPPLPGGMGAQEVLALITAMRYYEKAGEQDPLRGVGRNAERVFQTISVLGQPKQLNIVADHLISGGFQADAMLVLTLSLRQDPDQAGAHHQLARLFTLTGPTGEMKQAVQHAKRAVEIEPNNSAFKQTLRFIQKVVDGLDRT